MHSNNDHDGIRERFEEISPEVLLWLSVVQQAVWDSHQFRVKFLAIKGTTTALLRYREEILSDIYSPWFEHICEMANLDHESVVDRITSILRIIS